MQSHIHKVYTCVFTCNLPPALLAEWLGSFTCDFGNTGWNGYRNKESALKVDPEKKILLSLLQGFEPTTLRSRIRRSNHCAILTPSYYWIISWTYYELADLHTELIFTGHRRAGKEQSLCNVAWPRQRLHTSALWKLGLILSQPPSPQMMQGAWCGWFGPCPVKPITVCCWQRGIAVQKCLRNASVEGGDDVQRIVLGQKDEEGDDKQCRSEWEGTCQGQSSSCNHHVGVDTMLCCCQYNLTTCLLASLLETVHSIRNSGWKWDVQLEQSNRSAGGSENAEANCTNLVPNNSSLVTVNVMALGLMMSILLFFHTWNHHWNWLLIII